MEIWSDLCLTLKMCPGSLLHIYFNQGFILVFTLNTLESKMVLIGSDNSMEKLLIDVND